MMALAITRYPFKANREVTSDHIFHFIISIHIEVFLPQVLHCSTVPSFLRALESLLAEELLELPDFLLVRAVHLGGGSATEGHHGLVRARMALPRPR